MKSKIIYFLFLAAPFLPFSATANAQGVLRWQTVATNATASPGVQVYEVDTTTGAKTLTLYAADSKRTLTVCNKAGTSAVTIRAAGSDLINGAATFTLATGGDNATLWTNGNGVWYASASESASSVGGSFTTFAASSNGTIGGNLTVTGATALNGGLAMDTNKFTVADTSGNVATAGTLAVTGAATLSATLAVTGATTATGAVYANGGVDRSTAAALAIGATNATGVTITPALTCSSTIASGAITSSAGVTGTMFTSTAQTLTVADNGGGTAATATLTPTSSVVVVVCNDTDGCTITMGEGSAATGQRVTIVNTSANAANFADTAGVSELAGAFSMAQYDVLNLVYAGSTWIETARSNN